MMEIPFLKCKSSAESAFRLWVCSLALVTLILCLGQSVKEKLSDGALHMEIMKSAFAVNELSQLDAYRYRDIFREHDDGQIYSSEDTHSVNGQSAMGINMAGK